MRKMILFIAVLLFTAVPAMAASDVDITCTHSQVGDVNWVTVAYSTDHNLIRAFGLDINVAPIGGADGNIIDIVPLDANYRIYPGQILINDDGEVEDYNTPYDPCELVDLVSSIAVEMGSLYTMDANYAEDPNFGYGKIPGTSGDLLKFAFKNSCAYKVDVNARRGGIVMEDPCEVPSLDSPLCYGTVPGCEIKCTVPNVLDMDKDDADEAIEDAGLVPDGTGVYSCAEALNEVLSQDPAGDTEVECGSTVYYEYSLYQASVPDVVDIPLADANTLIINKGLVVGTITYECNSVIANGNVLRTDPVSGTYVDCASAVDIWVSLNPPAPGAATNPDPAAGAKCVPLAQVLSWTPGADTATQDVYFGITNPPPLVASDVPVGTTTYDPVPDMNVYTLYYWRIDEKNACGEMTAGTVWCLATGPQAGKACCNDEPGNCLGNVDASDNFIRSPDITALINFVKTLPPPFNRCATAAGSATCPPCYDLDGDGFVKSPDITALINRVKGFPPPLSRHSCPYPSCSNP